MAKEKLKLPTVKCWYCQPDGGQWNVPVIIVESFDFQGSSFTCIAGPKLSSPIETKDGWGNSGRPCWNIIQHSSIEEM